MIESTLKIARYCSLVIQGFSNFLGLFQGIMANPGVSPKIAKVILWRLLDVEEVLRCWVGKEEMRNEYLVK